ncbi:MAG: sulfotransferase [Cyanophyceae cyanobacterium]
MVKSNLTLSDRLLGAYQIVCETFGIWRSPLFTLFFYSSLRLIVSFGQYLDRLFYPQLRTKAITKPIILMGNPRSGTTFLQRFLVEHNIGSGLELWEMVFPSLTLQKLLQPFIPLLEKISPVRHHASVAHATSLTSIETDDAAVFLHYLDGFFLYGYLFAFATEDLSELFINQQSKNAERDFNWLSNIWQRNLVKKRGNRVVAKLFSLGIYLPQFLTALPDARILYLVRDPVESIPSAMNLVTDVLDKTFGFWSLPEDVKQRYLERLYWALVKLFERFHRDYTTGAIDHERVKVVSYSRLMSDFDNLMAEILEFTEIEPDRKLQVAIAHQAEIQCNYRSKHKYDLERFGLNSDHIYRDCAFVYETFLQQTTVI